MWQVKEKLTKYYHKLLPMIHPKIRYGQGEGLTIPLRHEIRLVHTYINFYE